MTDLEKRVERLENDRIPLFIRIPVAAVAVWFWIGAAWLLLTALGVKL